MIGNTAFQLVLGWLASIYLFAKTTVVVDFGGFSLSLWELWTSFSVIVIFITCILSPLFGQGINRDKTNYNREDDSY